MKALLLAEYHSNLINFDDQTARSHCHISLGGTQEVLDPRRISESHSVLGFSPHRRSVRLSVCVCVCVYMCVCVCVCQLDTTFRPAKLQKRLNRLRCRLREDSPGPKELGGAHARGRRLANTIKRSARRRRCGLAPSLLWSV